MMEALNAVGMTTAKLALDAAALRHQAIAHNLANLNSENYVPLRVSFDAQLAAAGRAVKPQLVQQLDQGAGPRPQDVDMEMVDLAQNTIHYQALMRGIGKQYAMLRDVISEGKR
jgi:flagellar basal-body rod protein FlgB